MRTPGSDMLASISYLAELADGLDDCVWMVDLTQWKLVFSNPSCETITGYTVEEYAKEPDLWKNIILEEDKPLVDLDLKLLFAKGRTDEEYRILKKTGEISWLASRKKIIKSAEGAPRYLLGIYTDITEKKQTAADLIKAMENLKKVMSNTEDLICSFNRFGVFLQVSVSSERLLGFKPDELVGHNFAEFIEKDDASLALKQGKAIILGAKLGNIQNRYQHKNGSTIWLSWSINWSEKDETFFCVARDITQQKHQQDSINRIMMALESSSDAVAISDEKFRSIYHNKAFKDILGYEPEDFVEIGYPCTICIEKDIRDEVNESLKDLKAWSGDAKLIAKDGTVVDFNGRINIVTNEVGETIGSVGIFTNISEIVKRASQEKAIIQRLQETLESITDGLFLIDNSWIVTYVNPAATKILKMNAAEMVGHNLWQLFPTAIDSPFYVQYHKVINERVPVSFTEFFDDFKIWFEIKAYPTSSGISVYFRDVTDKVVSRKTLELEREVLAMFAATESDFANTITHLFTGLEQLYPGMHCSLLKLDPASQTMLHVSAPSLPQVYISHINGIKIGPNVGSCGTAMFEKRQIIVSDIENAPLWSSFKELALSNGLKACWSFPIISNNNTVLGSIAAYYHEVRLPKSNEIEGLERAANIIRLLIENKRSNELLKISNERYQMVSIATNDAIWDWDLITNQTYWGDGYNTLFGYQSKPEGNHINDWIEKIHPDDRERVVSNITETIKAANTNKWENEYRFIKADGSFCDVYDRGFILYNNELKPIRMVGAIQDITERKAIEERTKKLNQELEKQVALRTRELEQANNELEAFNYTVSHDLRTPLRAMRMFISALESSKQADVEKQQQHFENLQRCVQEMNGLINDMLEYSKVGKQAMALEKIEMQQLIGETFTHLKSLEPDREIELVLENTPPIFADKFLIRQVMVNLLSNAIKFTGYNKHALITIGGNINGNFVEYFVKDNGVGFDMKNANKLFKPFSRLHSTTEFKGTGAGLSIVDRIIQKHGGKTWAIAEKGKGATFYFSLPL